MRLILFVLLIISVVDKSMSINGYPLIDARAISLGSCYSVSSGFANPSLYDFSSDRGKIVSLQYFNRFGMKELSTYAGLLNVPNSYLNAGFYVSRYGFKHYHETLASLHVYRKLARFLSLGIRVNYLNIHYSSTKGNVSAVNTDVFVSAQPVENLLISVSVVNPIAVGVRLGDEKTELPIVLSVGAAYHFPHQFSLLAEIEKDFSNEIIGKLGLEYTPIRQLSLRAGVYGKPFTPSFGLGLRFSSFVLDISFDRHPTLGFCSACGLSFHY